MGNKETSAFWRLIVRITYVDDKRLTEFAPSSCPKSRVKHRNCICIIAEHSRPQVSRGVLIFSLAGRPQKA